MASIKPYRNGYRAQLYVNGERDSGTFRLKKEAEAWAFRREEEMRAPKPVEPHTLKEALQRYAEEVSPGKDGERWEILRIAAFLRNKHLPLLIELRTVGPDDFGKWRDARLKEVQSGTVRREISLLSSVLESARREWQWLAANPLHDLRKPKAPQHREVVITIWQMLAMLRVMGYRRGSCKSSTQAVCVGFLLALRTGMRAGEICKLKWADVKEGHSIVTAAERGGRKSGKRTVPTVAHVERLIDSMRGWDTTYVFGLKSQTLDALFRRYRDRAGLSGFTFHDSRHTAATMLAERIDILDLCKMFGWKDPKQAMTYYNPSPDQIRRRIQRGRSR